MFAPVQHIYSSFVPLGEPPLADPVWADTPLTPGRTLPIGVFVPLATVSGSGMAISPNPGRITWFSLWGGGVQAWSYWGSSH